MIALVDYRAGNLTSIRKALDAVGLDAFIPESPGDLRQAGGIVVPGVGHFAATAVLDDRWRRELVDAVARGVPLLGICLGLQFLFEGSDEAPELGGLGLFSGSCRIIPAEAAAEDAGGQPSGRLKVPHVGWNTIDIAAPSRILDGIPSGGFAYFTHSFAAPVSAGTVATTTYGRAFAAVVERGHVAGVQFHPEKSAALGLAVLRNFASGVGEVR